MTIRIFVIATGLYKDYFEQYFIKTINRIFQDYVKEIILFSDGLSEYHNKIYDKTIIHVKHIYNLYKFDIQFNKFNFIKQEIDNCNNDDLLFYIDVDSIFNENKFAENYILNNYQDNNVHITGQPIYYLENLYTPDYDKIRKQVYENEQMYGSFLFTPDENKAELITSFMYFNKNSFNIFYNEYSKLIIEYLDNQNFPRILPNLNDEGIINYMYNMDIGNISGQELYITINLNYNENLEYKNNIIYIPWHNKNIGIDENCCLYLNYDNYIICNKRINDIIKKRMRY